MPVKPECRELVKKSPACHTREVRKWVGCRSAILRVDEKVPFGESVRRAWGEVEKICPKGAVRGEVSEPTLKVDGAKCGSKSSGMPDSAFDAEQLLIGTEHELEHTCDQEEAKRIAKDHLVEHPNYYVALDKMEKELTEQEKK
jgi:hypothetical protein